MEAKTTREIQAALAKPFAPEDLEWRLQNTNEEKMRGMAVPYVTNRAIQNRLDEVCGPENWYNEFKPWHSNGKKDSQLCGIAIHFEGKGFITKWDGAEDSDIEPIKGGLSDSMKRAAYQWGIGRVLYSLDKSVCKAQRDEQQGGLSGAGGGDKGISHASDTTSPNTGAAACCVAAAPCRVFGYAGPSDASRPSWRKPVREGLVRGTHPRERI